MTILVNGYEFLAIEYAAIASELRCGLGEHWSEPPNTLQLAPTFYQYLDNGTYAYSCGIRFTIINGALWTSCLDHTHTEEATRIEAPPHFIRRCP